MVEYDYDDAGNRLWLSDPRSTEQEPIKTEYAYDRLNRLTAIAEPLPSSQATEHPITSYTYYDDGQIKNEIDPLGRLKHHSYDGLGPDSNPDRYVLNSPTNYIDPDGREPVPINPGPVLPAPPPDWPGMADGAPPLPAPGGPKNDEFIEDSLGQRIYLVPLGNGHWGHRNELGQMGEFNGQGAFVPFGDHLACPEEPPSFDLMLDGMDKVLTGGAGGLVGSAALGAMRYGDELNDLRKLKKLAKASLERQQHSAPRTPRGSSTPTSSLAEPGCNLHSIGPSAGRPRPDSRTPPGPRTRFAADCENSPRSGSPTDCPARCTTTGYQSVSATTESPGPRIRARCPSEWLPGCSCRRRRWCRTIALSVMSLGNVAKSPRRTRISA